MPYDPRDEVTYDYVDYRDDPERNDSPPRYRPPRKPDPPGNPPRPSGPNAWDLIQMAQADEQMAAYLRTNPDPLTGLPPNPLVEVVNNPAVTVTPAEVKAINDPKKMMTPDGRIVKTAAMKVQRAALYPPINTKRTRKKTKMDRTMSKCLKMANAKARKKNGSLKKGWSQGRIMKEAHRLCRKHG